MQTIEAILVAKSKHQTGFSVHLKLCLMQLFRLVVNFHDSNQIFNPDVEL